MELLCPMLNDEGSSQSHRLKLLANEALVGIALSHVCHLFSVLVLYQLTLLVHSATPKAQRSKIAFIAAGLHIVSPAGMFLSAPYAESTFSLLNLTGYYLYASTFVTPSEYPDAWNDIYVMLSGLVFGIATTFRGNGLLSGLVLVYDALACISNILCSANFAANVRRLLVVSISGVLMAGIATWPQYLAFSEYCAGEDTDGKWRPWCSRRVPSIYAWVQEQYW